MRFIQVFAIDLGSGIGNKPPGVVGYMPLDGVYDYFLVRG